MSFEERRIYERRPFVEPIRYFVAASNMSEIEQIDSLEEKYNEGISIDISKGGLGMITSSPLKKGDVLFFEHEIWMENIKTISSTVRWVREVEDNRHLVGLQFYPYINT